MRRSIPSPHFHSVIILLLLSLPLHLQGQTERTRDNGNRALPSIEFLPVGKMLYVSHAQYGAASSQVAQFFGTEEVRIRLGTLFPIALLEWDDTYLLIGSGGSVTSDLQYRTRDNLLNADYYVDFLVAELRLRDHWMFRFGPGHTSHHLSDIGFVEGGSEEPFLYSRDYFHAGIHWLVPSKGFHVSVTAIYNYIFVAEHRNHDPWMISLGAQFTSDKMAGNVRFYAAGDWTIIADLGYAASQTVEAGILYQNSAGRELGLLLQYHTGLDDRGQFYGTKKKHSLLILRIQ